MFNLGFIKVLFLVFAVGLLQLFLMQLTSANGGLLAAVKRGVR